MKKHKRGHQGKGNQVEQGQEGFHPQVYYQSSQSHNQPYYGHRHMKEQGGTSDGKSQELQPLHRRQQGGFVVKSAAEALGQGPHRLHGGAG